VGQRWKPERGVMGEGTVNAQYGTGVEGSCILARRATTQSQDFYLFTTAMHMVIIHHIYLLYIL
jgi:hypothetical protein